MGSTKSPPKFVRHGPTMSMPEFTGVGGNGVWKGVGGGGGGMGRASGVAASDRTQRLARLDVMSELLKFKLYQSVVGY